MNVEKIDILCDQAIDVALVVKETNYVINNSQLKNYPQHFVNRIDSVVQYCHNMFINAHATKHTEEQINDLMINLMNTLVRYKNSYNYSSYGYKVMNSLLDIVKTTFVEFNN